MTAASTQPTHNAAAKESDLCTVLRVMDSFGVALVAFDREGRFSGWNAASRDLLGWQEEEILGQPVSRVLPDLVLSGGWNHPSEGLERSVETSARTKDGNSVDVAMRGIPVAVSGETQGGFLAILSHAQPSEELENALLEGLEREQQKLGNDLHDHLCQHLLGAAFAVKALAGDLDREGSRHAERLHELARLINDAVWQVREISRGYRPLDEESPNLALALEELCKRASRAVPCRFQCNSTISLGNCQKALQAYRIAQESVEHAVRETGAANIAVDLSRSGNSVRIEVFDNGSKEGPLTANSKDLAAKILRHRAHALGGALSVEFEEGAGTRMVCTFPQTQ